MGELGDEATIQILNSQPVANQSSCPSSGIYGGPARQPLVDRVGDEFDLGELEAGEGVCVRAEMSLPVSATNASQGDQVTYDWEPSLGLPRLPALVASFARTALVASAVPTVSTEPTMKALRGTPGAPDPRLESDIAHRIVAITELLGGDGCETYPDADRARPWTHHPSPAAPSADPEAAGHEPGHGDGAASGIVWTAP